MQFHFFKEKLTHYRQIMSSLPDFDCVCCLQDTEAKYVAACLGGSVENLIFLSKLTDITCLLSDQKPVQ